MTEGADESSNTFKRIKQLENQNIKLKTLLEAAMELVKNDDKGRINLQNESNTLKAKIEVLEKEKLKLEEELHAVLDVRGSDTVMVRQTVHKLEQENAELKTKFENIVKQIKKEDEDLGQLKKESSELKKILSELENEKGKLLEQIQTVGQSSSDLTNENLKWQKRLVEIESEKFSIMNTLDDRSDDTLPSIKSVEDTYKNYTKALEEQSSIKEKVSELEQKNEELIKVVQNADSIVQSQIKVNEEIIASNSNFLRNMDKVTSKMKEINNDFIKMMETPNVVEVTISRIEHAKLALYRELEQCLQNSSHKISHISQNISDPEIKRLVNEIEIQKTVLLYSLKSAKLLPGQANVDQDEIQVPSVPNSSPETSSDPNTFKSVHISSADDPTETKEHIQPSNSKDEHQHLEEEVQRLEQERERLLEQLRSISATSASRINDIVTQNERQLQTQSELHNTFMRESSHEVVRTQNYDDATNQLYANEDARLEQRIRELEIENIRIQRELNSILEEIRADKNEMNRLQFTGQVLRERIEELEQSTATRKN